MKKKVIIGVCSGVALIAVVTIGASLMGGKDNDVAQVQPTASPIVEVVVDVPEPTAEPVVETPAPEVTEAPIQAFVWEDIAAENDILYATLAGAKYMAEPREDADLVTEPAVDTELYIEAVAYVDGVPSIYIKTTYEGNPVYVDTTYIAEVVKEVADDTSATTDEQPADEQPAYLTKPLDEMTLNDFKNKELAGYKLTSEECRRVNELLGAPQTPEVGYGVAEEPTAEDAQYLNDRMKELGITFE